MRLIFAIIGLLACATAASAETRYIVDQATLPMRSGQSLSFKITAMLPSGMAVEVLEQSEAGYSRIRTPTGKDGWILSRYLMNTPAARDRLVRAEMELAKLNELKQQKKTVEAERDQLLSTKSRLEKELGHISETAANAVEIAAENSALKETTAAAEQELESLRQQTRDIRNGAQQRWFMLGGGAILLGILLGLILPRMKVRRKSQWGGY
ncbi:MAG: TIGR04211 family SH3 domain-containing protein [Zetaproteobacteria bacterium CG12_big_fil_rev_8_21_14_0_65_54_13]|nr:MAG: TIGR04211 family SH3 domain-containing protein [Zetaproteobacteria bacterium CG12_big_fil_rev_8_21_14_0_65_54_13]PIX53665.1 MAG: TIGR04211 family SH3 domain-containing protein [Zetaproteobacteria bacterium CG_4_10_14_3_um_filter_54_28]PJA27942.1 MAG: TIGR04211 family SH3 domain-containing protein [Zetaproteobacteria bacterium CG_4_9_14_3_um_filter_54_145]